MEKNIDTAIEWFTKAADKGHVSALNSIGTLHYEAGRYKEAFPWFSQAAIRGEVMAEHNIGLCYKLGRGVTKDIPKAIEWFTKAAEKGFANAVKELRELGQPVPVA